MAGNVSRCFGLTRQDTKGLPVIGNSGREVLRSCVRNHPYAVVSQMALMFGKYQHIFERAQPYLDTRDNVLHTIVAFSFAVRLLEDEDADESVVLPAVLLHDVGWKRVPEDLQLKAFGPGRRDAELNKVHEVEGARIAAEILSDVCYDPESAREIVEIIGGHDSRKEALSLNDAVVKDSDRLWRFSAEALEVDPKRFGIDPAVHTEWLKLQIDGWFYTPTAKRIATQEQTLRALSLAKDKQQPGSK